MACTPARSAVESPASSQTISGFSSGCRRTNSNSPRLKTYPNNYSSMSGKQAALSVAPKRLGVVGPVPRTFFEPRQPTAPVRSPVDRGTAIHRLPDYPRQTEIAWVVQLWGVDAVDQTFIVRESARIATYCMSRRASRSRRVDLPPPQNPGDLPNIELLSPGRVPCDGHSNS